MSDVVLHVRGDTLTMVYSERLDLRPLGKLSITRASRVEPDENGHWWVEIMSRPDMLSNVCLGPFSHRSQALAAEVDWLEKHL